MKKPRLKFNRGFFLFHNLVWSSRGGWWCNARQTYGAVVKWFIAEGKLCALGLLLLAFFLGINHVFIVMVFIYIEPKAFAQIGQEFHLCV